MGFEAILVPIVIVFITTASVICFMLFIFAWGIYQTFKSLFQLVRVKKDKPYDHVD